MPKPRSGFSGLLSGPPAPLPDDDEPETAAQQQPPIAAAPDVEEPQAPIRSIVPAKSAPRESRPKTDPPAPAPPGPAGEERVATTIRLHRPAAVALNGAWLDERRNVNPKLSYPEFASEIVRLGLAAFVEQQSKAR